MSLATLAPDDLDPIVPPTNPPYWLWGWSYHALDVVYEHRTLLAGGPLMWTLTATASLIGNRRARLEAEQLAAPQWRPLGAVGFTIYRDHSVLQSAAGHVHDVLWHVDINGLVATQSGGLEIRSDAAPLLMFGPAAWSLGERLRLMTNSGS